MAGGLREPWARSWQVQRPSASRVDLELVLCEDYAELGHPELGDREVSRYVFGELDDTPDRAGTQD